MNNLYIAVENKNRELLGKVLLACVAAENGFTSVVGMNREIKYRARFWAPGIILWKGLARKGGDLYKKFHKLGHSVVAWCEEGLVYPSSEFYQQYRVFAEALNEVDLFFAWGQNQARDILFKVPEGIEKVVIAGNPRIDILREEFRAVFSKEVKEIRDEYGPFILINSNFSAYTHKLGPETAIASLKKAGRIRTDEDEIFYQGRSENRKVVFNAFTDAIGELARIDQGVSIILRPHSAESVELWEDSLENLPNIHLIHRGSAMPWILASELLIHNDCTTGLEAFLLEKPVIAYRPTAENPYESKLPIAVSKSIEKEDELVATVTDFMQRRAEIRREDADEMLSRYISNYKDEYSVDIIVKALNEFKESHNKLIYEKLKILYKTTRNWIRKIVIERSWSKFLTGESGSEEFSKDKFPGLEVNEVRGIIAALGLNSNRFKDLYVSAVPGTSTCIQIKRITR